MNQNNQLLKASELYKNSNQEEVIIQSVAVGFQVLEEQLISGRVEEGYWQKLQEQFSSEQIRRGVEEISDKVFTSLEARMLLGVVKLEEVELLKQIFQEKVVEDVLLAMRSEVLENLVLKLIQGECSMSAVNNLRDIYSSEVMEDFLLSASRQVFMEASRSSVSDFGQSFSLHILQKVKEIYSQVEGVDVNGLLIDTRGPVFRRLEARLFAGNLTLEEKVQVQELYPEMLVDEFFLNSQEEVLAKVQKNIFRKDSALDDFQSIKSLQDIYFSSDVLRRKMEGFLNNVKMDLFSQLEEEIVQGTASSKKDQFAALYSAEELQELLQKNKLEIFAQISEKIVANTFSDQGWDNLKHFYSEMEIRDNFSEFMGSGI